MSEELGTYNPQGEMVIYRTEDGKAAIDVVLENETVWLTQQQIADLYGKSKSTISEHLHNIFEDGELFREVVVRKFRTTTQHGAIQGKTQVHETDFYNLDVILAVGYRVRSKRGIEFRLMRRVRKQFQSTANTKYAPSRRLSKPITPR